MTIDYTQPPPIPQSEPPRRSWWSRNWGWVVALGCLTPILLVGGCFAGLAWIVVSSIRSTDVYEDAVARAKNDPRVIEALGAPVEARWWITGNLNVEGSRGEADFNVPLQGSRNKGTLEVEGGRDGGDWTFSVLQVRVDDGPTIDLMPETAPSPEESPGIERPDD